MQLNNPTYTVVDNFKIPALANEQVFRAVLRYKPTSDDVFIVTYPKCGTTWLQQIAYLIQNRGCPPQTGSEFILSCPFIEVMGINSELRIKPHFMKSHLPFNMIPFSSDAKYILVFRNPKDCCESFYHHTKSATSYRYSEGTFDHFFELFMKGSTDFGDYFDHLLSWYKHRNDPNVMSLTYEGMKLDHRKSILQIASFLGKDYFELLSTDEMILKNVLSYSSFEYMKKVTNEQMASIHDFKSSEGSPGDLKPKFVEVVRKGEIGQWRKSFSEEQNVEMNKKIMERIGHTEYYEFWKNIGCI